MGRAVFFILVTLLAYTPVFAQVRFEDSSFDEALAKAKREGKILFVIYEIATVDKDKKERLFSDYKLGYLMNHRYVNYRVTDFQNEGKYLMKQYKLNVLPTLMMLNNDGEELSRHVSTPNYEISNFIKVLNSMVENSIASGRTKFRTSLDGANQFIQMLNDNYLVEERNIALVDLFNRRTKDENYNEENFDFYASMISSIFHPIAQFTLTDKKNVVKYIGKDKYEKFISNNVNKTLNSKFQQGSITENELDLINKMASENKEVKTNLLSYYNKNYPLTQKGDIAKITKNTVKVFKKLSYEDKREVIRYVNTISLRENKLDEMLVFYDNIISITKSETERRRYNESKRRIQGYLDRQAQ